MSVCRIFARECQEINWDPQSCSMSFNHSLLKVAVLTSKSIIFFFEPLYSQLMGWRGGSQISPPFTPCFITPEILLRSF